MNEPSLYEKVVSEFKDKKLSVLQISDKLGISVVKTRRILITEGLWCSRSSDEIGELYKNNYTVKQIAEKLHMTEKNVQAYLPYSKGLYGQEKKSDSAVWCDDFRERKKNAVKKQVVNHAETNEDVKRGEIYNMKEEQKTNTKHMIPPLLMKLHIELDTKHRDDYERKILKKYAKVNNGLSRDILVPSDITLNALHYVIQRLFGWQNSHLHRFSVPENVFENITGNMVKEWMNLCGVYFRFPDEDFEDRYWDSDYDESIAFKSWLKRKYKGPYVYGGIGDYYYENQEKCIDLKMNLPEFEVRQTFQEFREKKPNKHRRVRLLDATISELDRSVEFGDTFNSLLERLFVMDYLFMPNREYDVLSEHTKKKIEFLQREMKDNIKAWKKVIKGLPETKEMYEMMVTLSTIRIQPITPELVYEYDYGDNWHISIKCTEAYYDREYNPFVVNEDIIFVDSKGELVSEDTLADIRKVLMNHSPICLESDGFDVMDDVGGIGGYADFLRRIHESDDENERDGLREWARSLGWTGRNLKPQNRL